MDILRLALGSLHGRDARAWPVHGFLVTHPAGPVLVDTGIGGPEPVLRDWRAVVRSLEEALADHDMTPGDVVAVVNTHLHFDHCGWNAVLRHAPFLVQGRELERARRESRWLCDWFDFAGARFELVDGDAEPFPGIRLVATPGHTVGHQSVVVERADGSELLIGDAAYTRWAWNHPDAERLVEGQADDLDAWRRSLRGLRDLPVRAVHFCHDAPMAV